jgi:hypothetical protein
MIDVKDAVKCAFQSLEYLFSKDTINNPMLEEVKLSKDETHWFITLGFNVKEAPNSFLETLGAGATLMRKYKVFKIEAKTGRFVSMKIRKV